MLRIFLFFFFPAFCFSQAGRLSGPEKCWALFHPFAALKVRSIGKDAASASARCSQAGLDKYSSGGKADAFRHVFYMAAFAQKVKIKKLRKLGKAHEKGNYRQFLRSRQEDGELPDSLSSVMDLRNNELGLSLGGAHKNESLEQLCVTVLSSIRSGQATIMKRDKNGNYLDCKGERVPQKEKKKWNIPKCLVGSNEDQTD